jgi:type IV pilus assembly protein PilC
MKRFFLWIKTTFFDPMVVITVMAVIILFSLKKVVPTFEQVFLSVGGKLPPSTQFVIYLSHHLWILFLALPLYWGISYLKEKGTVKLGWLKAWMLVSLLGLFLAFIVVAMFLPMFYLGN